MNLHETISVKDSLALEQVLFIDMRTPAEFSKGHIPGAYNLPLFENEERAEIGTLYKQVGPETAKSRGLDIVAPRLPGLVRTISEYASLGKEIVIYCWRGGMRSGSVVSVLAMMGIRTRQLQGGYKAYRNYVLERLQGFTVQAKAVVLCGSTGTGKTQLLYHLARLGVPVLDLERLANHRGSVFGHVGLGGCCTAQSFDSLLLAELERVNQGDYFVVECESKRIGNLYLPECLYEAMQVGYKVLVKTPLALRVSRLCEEYVQEDNAASVKALIASMQRLQKQCGQRKIAEWTEQLEQGDFPNVIETLLKEYYDPIYGYEKAELDEYAFCVDASDFEAAAATLTAHLETLRR